MVSKASTMSPRNGRPPSDCGAGNDRTLVGVSTPHQSALMTRMLGSSVNSTATSHVDRAATLAASTIARSASALTSRSRFQRSDSMRMSSATRALVLDVAPGLDAARILDAARVFDASPVLDVGRAFDAARGLRAV